MTWLALVGLFVAFGSLPAELAVVELRAGRAGSAALYALFVVVAIYLAAHALLAFMRGQ